MLGIPVKEPAFVFGDNKSVLANTSVPGSMIKKKIREGCARDEWRTAYVNTHLNCADMLTKALPPGEKRSSFIRKFLYWL